MDIIDGLGNFAKITRGALGTGPSICCETNTSRAASTFLDKGQLLDIDLTINAKNKSLKTLTDTVHNIIDSLVYRTEYPQADEWQIVDIVRGAPAIPNVIGRDEENLWIMAAGVIVKLYRKV